MTLNTLFVNSFSLATVEILRWKEGEYEDESERNRDYRVLM
jgi:hypothetical protein